MIEEGVIIGLKGKMAEIKVGRHEDCSGCGACGSAKNISTVVYNEIGAKVGDRVKFSMPEENIVTGAFVVVVLPLIFAGIGAAVAFIFLEEYVPHLAIVFFLLSLIFVKLYDKKKRHDLKYNAKIIEII